MKCPFLTAANVKYCDASAYRKMILKAASDTGSERCSSSSYHECPALEARFFTDQRPERCPFLHEAEMEFCSAAPLPKYIPATDDFFSRCNSDRHLFCELYLKHADPGGARFPEKLWYAPNHMWLDVAVDGTCHIGLDAFAARVIAKVDRIAFVSPSATRQPIAVITVGGIDLQMVFPNPLTVTAINAYLRTAPQRVIEDPYGTGWLFEGVDPVLDGLIAGPDAPAWFRAEEARLSTFVHDRVHADGGFVVHGLTEHMGHDDLLCLMTEFFAPQRTWRSAC